MADGNGKKYRPHGHNLRSWKFANAWVFTLSRRKHGFESRRARQRSLSIRPRLEGYAAGATSKRGGGSPTAAWSAPCRIPCAWFATGACSTTPCGSAPRPCRPYSHRRRPPKSCCYARPRRRKRAGENAAVLLVDGHGKGDAVEPRLGRRRRSMMRIARPEDDRLALPFPGPAKVGDRALLRRRGRGGQRCEHDDPSEFRHVWSSSRGCQDI